MSLHADDIFLQLHEVSDLISHMMCECMYDVAPSQSQKYVDELKKNDPGMWMMMPQSSVLKKPYDVSKHNKHNVIHIHKLLAYYDKLVS